MSAIGPGDWLQAVNSAQCGPNSVTTAAIYQAADVIVVPRWPCFCGEPIRAVQLVGQDPAPFGHPAGWCVCLFRPWPPVPPAELRCEVSGAEESEAVPA